jgi:hypothetical protein
MRQIDDSHFAPHSVGKINVTYQHAKKKKSKASLKGMSVICICWLQNQEIYITGTAPYSTGTVIFLFHFW